MTTPTFPSSLADKQDQKYFSEKIEDQAARQELDGGYTVTRTRFTRRPRRSFTSGFTDLPDADKKTMMDFYESVRGGSDAFIWTNPTTDTTHTVRFVGDLEAKYAGIGERKLWNIQFSVEEV